MGITQLPTTPVPTAKGDIIVGTANGATRLPVSATNNQSLITDSTQITGLKYGSSSRTWNTINALVTNPTSGATDTFNGAPDTKVIYGNGIYAYVSAYYVWYSTDKITWNAQAFNAAFTNYGLDIAFNGTTWVIAGGANGLFSGTPGGTWTARTSNISTAASDLRSVIWQSSNSLFIVFGPGNIAPWNCISTSPDGITWTARHNIGSSLTTSYSATNNGSTTVVTSSNATNSVYFSTNGTSWTGTNANNGSSLNSVQIIYLPTQDSFVSLGSNQYAQTVANIASAWATVGNNYYTFTKNQIGQVGGTNRNKPVYDSVRGVWYLLAGTFPSTAQTGPVLLATISDTGPVRTYFDASFNYYRHKINSLEYLPIAAWGGVLGWNVASYSLANNTLFIVFDTGANQIIIYSDLV